MYKEAITKFLAENGLSSFDLKAVLFDMDGVLFDSMPMHVKAWTQTFHEFGIPFTEEESYLHEGRTGSDTINIIFNREWGRNATSKEIKQIYLRKAGLFDAMPEAKVMPGVSELLNKIKSEGLERIIVTGSGQKALLSKIDHYFPGQFSRNKMVTAYDVTNCKPNPEPYMKGLRKAGVGQANAIVIENAPLGVTAAKAAGIFTIGVNTGKLPDSCLTEAGADITFHGMPSLNEHWLEIYEELKSQV